MGDRSWFFISFFVLTAALPIGTSALTGGHTLTERYSYIATRYKELKSKYEQARKTLDDLESRAGDIPIVCDGRLTISSGTALPTADVAASTNVYFTPFRGNKVSIWSTPGWKVYQFTEITLALGAVTSGFNYDIFIYEGAGGAATLEKSAAWTDDSTRSEGIELFDGVYVKTSDHTRRYLGTIRTTSTTQTIDSAAQRFVWNYCNRMPRRMLRLDTTNTWATTSTWRQVRAQAANELTFVVGVQEVLVGASANEMVDNSATSVVIATGMGDNSSTTNIATLYGGFKNATTETPFWAEHYFYPSIGYHELRWLESSDGTNSVTFWGDNGSTRVRTGITGWIEG